MKTRSSQHASVVRALGPIGATWLGLDRPVVMLSQVPHLLWALRLIPAAKSERTLATNRHIKIQYPNHKVRRRPPSA